MTWIKTIKAVDWQNPQRRRGCWDSSDRHFQQGVHFALKKWGFAMLGLRSEVHPQVGRRRLVHSDQLSATDSPFDADDEVDDAALATVMRHVPLGAGVLAGAAVALLVIGYLLIYLLVFIPRGTIG